MRAFQMWGAPHEHASHFLYTPRIQDCPAKFVPEPSTDPDTHAGLGGISCGGKSGLQCFGSLTRLRKQAGRSCLV